MQPWDVVIVGAGAAGLAALNELDRSGCENVICLEARPRIGGRIYTVMDPLCPFAIDLGAEFVHGRSPEVWNLIRTHNLPAYQCGDARIRVRDGEVQSDASSAIDKLMEQMRRAAENGKDQTFLEFVQASGASEEVERWATGFVEGFNAARKEQVSIRALAQEALAADAIHGDTAFRLVNGYGSIPQALLHSVKDGLSKLRLNCVVESIAWQQSDVSVRVRHALTGRVFTVRARRAIITVPLGVLQAGDIHFSPEPAEIFAAIQAVRFGQVARISLRFRETIWDTNDDLFLSGFLLSDEPLFPTWWTPLALQGPVITGWSAGPKADALLGKPPSQWIDAAVGSLSRILRMDSSLVYASLESAYLHNWSVDPFSRGAYSYVPAGALPLRDRLAQPVANTLFFAGEATETEGRCATVHGAIATGRRAARQVLAERLS